MKEKRPLIGVSGSIIIDQGGRFPGYERSYVNHNYITSVLQEGGTPFIIPFHTEKEVIRQQVEQIDGLVLSGGQDVNPLLYGEEPLALQGPIFPERDEFDKILVQTAIELGKPVFAICRGIQILNVAYGGTVYQDLSYIENCSIKHDQYSGPSYATHTVSIAADSFLHQLFGDTVVTNSFHHQAIKDVAPGFKVVAQAQDGVIEGIEKEEGNLVVGVQWHPEMMTKEHDNMATLFQAFVERAKESLVL